MKSQAFLTILLLALVTACAQPGVPTPISLPNVPVITKPPAPIKAPPTPTAPTKAPSTPIAVYIPQPSERPVTIKRDYTQVSCDGMPSDMWRSAGTYLYKQTTDSSDNIFLTVEQEPGKASPNFGEARPPQGNISRTVVGVEDKTTGLGTFQAVRVDTAQEYRILTTNHSDPQGLIRTSEWYVCGLGIIHSSTSHAGTYQGRSFQKRSEVVLLSFTPISTNESHVRYILVDLQLGNVAFDYRADIADEETAEALRRWDAGIRVANTAKFERKTVDGQWLIVYVGTENPIIGMDVILTSGSRQ